MSDNRTGAANGHANHANTAPAPQDRTAPVHLPPPADVLGHGLRLRAWRTGDEATLVRGHTDPEFLRWNTPLVPVTTEAGATEHIRQRAEGRANDEMAHFCVTDEATGRILGHVGLAMIDLRMRSARVGYWVLPEARGRGVARRALAVCGRWGFEEAGLHRIDLGHALGHEASCRIAERCGYAYEGTLRDAMFAPHRTDAYQHVHHHARLATDPDLDPYPYPAEG
ncbi:GNAT family N-acetyltransferase [Streptomyces liangshanensis]|uniref:GNAT family N-acetyltransferase n=1 Tax=Streptomyces liangshanensis TaxID=2717324 RepID=A0A6G9H1V7_9ACTN|nr:GNAT family N-acetyltransferase [Streptomyces liangshanensis]